MLESCSFKDLCLSAVYLRIYQLFYQEFFYEFLIKISMKVGTYLNRTKNNKSLIKIKKYR